MSSAKDKEKVKDEDHEKQLNKFKAFLENHLRTLTNCHVTYCTCFDPVVASDGYVYEKTAFKDLIRHTLTSPVTREHISTEFKPIDLVSKIIDHVEPLELEITSSKYITSTDFEENIDIIVDAIENKKYDNVKKFNKFKLGMATSDGNLFINRICKIRYTDESEGLKYLEIFRYIIDNSDDIDFIKHNSNILHSVFKYAMYIHILEYVMDKLKTMGKLIQYSTMKDSWNECTPIDLGFQRDKLVIDCMQKYNLITPEFILKSIGSIVKSCSDEDFIISMLANIKDVNEKFNDEYLISIAVNKNKYKVVKFLIQKGANLDIPSCCSDHSVIYNIFRHGSDDILKTILDIIDMEKEIKDGWRPFHFVCYFRKKEMIHMMIDKGVSVNVPIKKFQGEDKDYLPMQLIELNERINESGREELIERIIQMMFS